jgi:hypothetical protein
MPDSKPACSSYSKSLLTLCEGFKATPFGFAGIPPYIRSHWVSALTIFCNLPVWLATSMLAVGISLTILCSLLVLPALAYRKCSSGRCRLPRRNADTCQKQDALQFGIFLRKYWNIPCIPTITKAKRSLSVPFS